MKTVRIAITGLSRSGKTVFITSLLNQLNSDDRRAMNNFPRKGERYPLLTTPASIAPGNTAFPYEDNLSLFRQTPPKWPPSTTIPSEIAMLLTYIPESQESRTGIKRLSKRTAAKARTLRLELADYPGEWVVDMPMLRQDFHDWSSRQIDLAKASRRTRYSSTWVEQILSVDPNAPFKPEHVHLAITFRDYLQQCRDSDKGLTFLQPGRFLSFGGHTEACVSESDLFCPLPFPQARASLSFLNRKSRDSLYNVFKRRYEKYKKDNVETLYDEIYAKAQVQIVLVDVLHILSKNLDCYNEAKSCINAILRAVAFRRSQGGFARRHKLHKTVFAVTKADHCTPNQHENLKALAKDLLSKAHDIAELTESRGGLAAEDPVLISSVRSTQPVKRIKDGRKLDCLRGRLDPNSDEEKTLYPGQIPSCFPEEGWDVNDVFFPSFQPRKFPSKEGAAVPHINLDVLLGLAIGSELR